MQDNVFGWAIVDKNGCTRDVRHRITDFFGVSEIREPLSQENINHFDREWPGLAPHKIVVLYTASPDVETLQEENKQLKIDLKDLEEDFNIRKEMELESSDQYCKEIRILKAELAAAKAEIEKPKDQKR